MYKPNWQGIMERLAIYNKFKEKLQSIFAKPSVLLEKENEMKKEILKLKNEINLRFLLLEKQKSWAFHWSNKVVETYGKVECMPYEMFDGLLNKSCPSTLEIYRDELVCTPFHELLENEKKQLLENVG